jgi:hypothetical protein
MRAFFARRFRNTFAAVLVCFVLWDLLLASDYVLKNPQFFSGWVLLGLTAVLAVYNIRKKLTMIPLGKNATWLQWHVYLGWIALFVFFVHIEWRIPNGGLEVILAILFLLVSISGVVGLYLSRRLAPRLTSRGEEVIFERIPMFVKLLRTQAEDLVVEAAVETESATLSDFYYAQAGDFFAGTRNVLAHLRSSRRPLFSLFKDLRTAERYMNDKELEYSDRLRRLLEKKDELDYHYALQAALKSWLFIHIPTTFSMIIIMLIHVLVIYVFGSSF